MDFEEYKKNNEIELRAVEEKLMEPASTRATLEGYTLYRIKKEIVETLLGEFGNKNEVESAIQLELPPGHVSFDLAFSVFKLGNVVGEKNLKTLVNRVVDILNKDTSSSRQPAEAIGPFVNFKIKDDVLIQSVLGNIKTLGLRYGESDGDEGSGGSSGKVALVEYSSTNIAKPIGVGHMRSTIIGQALANLFEATGFKTVIRHNYLGDWGTQFGKLAYAYELWGNEAMLEKDALRNLKDLYVRFHEEEEKDPALEEKGREYAKRLEDGDQELLELWAHFRRISIGGFKKTFDRLGVHFDTYLGESYFGASEGKDHLVELCLKEGIAQVDSETGAVVVEGLKGGEGKELPTFILRKKDGTTLYLSRDLAALKTRLELWHPDFALIVVGKEQELHFRQLFALAKKLGILQANTMAKHIDFGTVLADGKKMSTRKGSLVELEGLLEESVEKAKSILKKKNPELSDAMLKENAEVIGVGAIIYNDLRQSRERNISFDWERMLNFETGSAAYLQYTAVRIGSILEKVEKGDIYVEKLEPIERSLLIKLSFFPKVVLQASTQFAPHLLSTYLEELAQLFNSFYGLISVKDTKDHNHRRMRIQMISSVRTVIENGLRILNIRVPKKM